MPATKLHFSEHSVSGKEAALAVKTSEMGLRRGLTHALTAKSSPAQSRSARIIAADSPGHHRFQGSNRRHQTVTTGDTSEVRIVSFGTTPEVIADHREFPRFECRAPVILVQQQSPGVDRQRIPTSRVCGRLHDISQGGMAAEVPGPLPTGSPVIVRMFDLSTETVVSAGARVLRCVPSGPNSLISCKFEKTLSYYEVSLFSRDFSIVSV